MKNTSCPIVALITDKEVGEFCIEYTSDGKLRNLNIAYNLDLFFAPEKQEGWINIFKVACANAYLKESRIYSSKEIAESEGRGLSNYLSTIKIEWEE